MDDAPALAEDIEQAIGYLRLLSGDDFMIGHDEQGYWLTPYGQIGHIMRAAAPGKLGELMNDYAGTAR
jgi:hypothetical protein